MKSLNNGKERATKDISCTSTSIRIGLHLIAVLTKGSHGNPQITQTIAKTIGCSSKTDRKDQLLKKIFMQVIQNKEVELALICSLHPNVMMSSVREGTLHASKGEVQTPTQFNPFDLKSCLVSKMC